MSVFKSLNSQDIIASPFEVNKSFTFTGISQLSSSKIERHLGENNGVNSKYYNSIKQLYYSNYISGSEGEISNASTASLNSDGTLSGPIYSTLYNNYLSTNLNPQRYFPTASNSTIGIISIPQEIYGDYIQPHSLNIITENGNYLDDGEGRLVKDTEYYGNIIYEHGLIILTKDTPSSIQNFVSSSTIKLSFSSSLTIYETQYKCTINENEFNYTLNPSVMINSSVISGSDGKIYDHFTGSYFAPYITTVGLYNDNKELMAVGKLAQPLPTSRTTDTTILLNIDRT